MVNGMSQYRCNSLKLMFVMAEVYDNHKSEREVVLLALIWFSDILQGW